MEIERLREFIAFSRSMNFTTAARDLHLSQPALSKHIQDLEGELRVQLVSRGSAGEGNQLTPTGVLFVELAAQLLQGYDAMVEECRELFDQMPPVRIQGVQHGFAVASQLRQRMEAAGLPSGNFRNVKIDVPICDALDQGMVDFALHLEATPAMGLFESAKLRDTYGWLPLDPEPLCFLVGGGNSLFGVGDVSAEDVSAAEVVYGTSPSYESWSSAVSAVFIAHGCSIGMKGIPDAPSEGGAYPIGPRRLCVCTARFAHYYQDLDAEVTSVLRVREFDPQLFPFLVYRRDNTSPAVEQIVSCFAAPPRYDEG